MKIKPFPILLACFLPLLGFGQGHPTGLSSPILTNFWIRDFNIDVLRPNTQLLKLNLNSQQFDNGGSTITITNFGNASGGTNVFNTIYVSNVFTTNITVLNNTVTSNLFVTNLFVTNLTVFDTTITSNLFVTNITANTIITTNLFVTNLFVTYEVVSNVVAGNIQGTPPHIAMFRPDNFSVADSIVTQNADTNGITVNGTGFGSITLGGTGSGQSIIWGDGGTNVLFRSGGSDLIYTNGATTVNLGVLNQSGIGISLEAQSATSAGIITAGSPSSLFLRNGSQQVIMISNEWRPVSDLGLSLGDVTGPRWNDITLGGTLYVSGFLGASVTNYSRGAISHSGNGASWIFDSQAGGTGVVAWISFTNAPVVVHKNIGAIITGGDTTFVNMQKATQTNQLSGALTFAHATNGTDLVEWTHRRYLFNPSGANRLITLPAGWHNISGATFTVTNSTMARLDVTSWGDTSSSALQTNVSSVVTFMP